MKRKYKNKLIAIAALTILLIAIIFFAVKCFKCHDDTSGMNNQQLYNKYNKEFDDLNPTQLKAAKKYGIEPVEDRNYDFDADERLTKITPCEAYDIDELTHSVPYLTHAAARLLKDIADGFQQKQGEEVKIIVTSVLRTKEDVRRLQGVNVNASSNSTHCYATTFDITYIRFRKKGLVFNNDINDDKYLIDLAEVIQELRDDHRCYVRFELSQHCFHITTRD